MPRSKRSAIARCSPALWTRLGAIVTGLSCVMVVRFALRHSQRSATRGAKPGARNLADQVYSPRPSHARACPTAACFPFLVSTASEIEFGSGFGVSSSLMSGRMIRKWIKYHAVSTRAAIT